MDNRNNTEWVRMATLLEGPRLFSAALERGGVDTIAPPPKLNIEEFLPTVDQLNYAIHCLKKQIVKVEHAHRQLHDTITKFDILREYLKEKESTNVH
jgi:PleD family two-component response regulator